MLEQTPCKVQQDVIKMWIIKLGKHAIDRTHRCRCGRFTV